MTVISVVYLQATTAGFYFWSYGFLFIQWYGVGVIFGPLVFYLFGHFGFLLIRSFWFSIYSVLWIRSTDPARYKQVVCLLN